MALKIEGSNPFAHPISFKSDHAPVAQWIEHQSSELRVGGSNPFWRAFIFQDFVSKITVFIY